MKKLVVALACLFAVFTAKADNDKPVQVNQLPQKAQQLIQQNFASAKVAMAKVETEFLYKTYDVIFADGNKLEFDKAGNWTEVDCKYSEVPAAIIPAQIRAHISATYPDVKILKIERDSKRYEVKLSNGWEVEYDGKFRVVDMDR